MILKFLLCFIINMNVFPCVIAAERSGEEYRAGFQEAVGEAVRFLVEVQGFRPGDGLCLQLAAHLQRHCEIVTKGTSVVLLL